MDKTEKAINGLLDAVNKEAENFGKGEYLLRISPRVGRNNQEEQYAFIYRSVLTQFIFQMSKGWV